MLSKTEINFHNRFQRSIRIDTDYNDLAIFDTFVSSDTSNKTIIEFCNQVNNGQYAFTWTGSYGSGKSSLAVILHGILSHKNTELYKKSSKIISNDAKNSIEQSFNSFSKRSVIPIIANKSDLEDVIRSKLSDLVQSNKKNHSLSDLILSIPEGQQVIIFVDELGKYLEYASSNNKDIMFLQDLAELCNRSKGSLIFVGILHQAFSEYSKSADNLIRQEWSKIQGRFIDTPINVTAEEHINLLSYSLSFDKRVWQDFDPSKFILKYKQQLKEHSGWISEDSLNNLYPLNPISAQLISAISRRSFSQNQRTIFGFINSIEPYGFKSIYTNLSENPNFQYGPFDLWDYLYTNFDVPISNSSDSHNWISVNDTIDRAKNSIDEICLKILKTIGLIQIFGGRALIKNDFETLYASLPFEKKELLDESINYLLEKKFIIYREITQSFAITEASDFDVEQTLRTYLENQDEPDSTSINQFFEFRPIIGKRHYIETGNFRYMPIRLIKFSDLDIYLNDTKMLADGEIIICLPFKNETPNTCRESLRTIVKNINHPIAVSLPNKFTIIISTIKKILALIAIQENEEIIKVDRIARKEIATIIDQEKILLDGLIEEIIPNSEWFVSKYNKKSIGKWEKFTSGAINLNTAVSDLFDDFYFIAPKIKNELTNKTRVSPNANQSIRIILNRMLEHDKEPLLGIKKTPPELTIYNAIIREHNLHQQNKDGKYGFVYPGKNSPSFQSMWGDAIDLISNADEYINAEQLFDLWSKPPYGIKRGLFPIILMLFILTNKSTLAVYHENIFITDFDDVMVQYLLKLPKDFSFTIVNLAAANENLQNYYKSISKYISESINPNVEELPLTIGKALVKLLKSQPEWVRNTQNLTTKTLALRDELKKASDPIDLVIKVLPKIFGDDIKAFEKSLNEISTTYDLLIQELKTEILKTFRYDEDSDLSELHLRAETILKMSGDLTLDPFIVQMKSFDGTPQSVERVLLTLLRKDPKNMNDNDIKRIYVELSNAVDEFMKVEAHAKISKRKYKSTSLSILYGGSDNKEVHNYDFKLNNKEMKKAKQIASNINDLIQDNLGNGKQESLFQDADTNIILGALSEYMSRYIKNDK